MQRGCHVAEHRLGCRDGGAGIFAANCGDLVVQRLERGEEGFKPRRVIVRVGGIGRAERRGQRLGDRRHRRRIVPKVRIVAGLLVHEIGGDDHNAPGLRRHLEQPFHPRVVVGAVVDDHLRRGDLADDGRRGLEQMRVLVGIAQDAGDRNLVAADLLRHVAVEILRRHDRDFAAGRAGAGEGRKCDQQRRDESDGRLHRQGLRSLAENRHIHHFCL